jgi:integrase
VAETKGIRGLPGLRDKLRLVSSSDLNYGLRYNLRDGRRHAGPEGSGSASGRAGEEGQGRVPRHLINRFGVWHYYRRIPARFADVDPRTFVTISLETRDLARAEKLKGQVEREVEAYWVALKKGESADARQRYLGALERARLEGFEYRPAADVAGGELAELRSRIRRLEEMLEEKGSSAEPLGPAEKQAVDALLGGADVPQLTLSNALDQFYEFTRDRVRQKSDDQMRRWKAPRLKAINNLVALVGDKRVAGITRADALALRRFWVNRVVEEGYTANSANKDIGHLAQIFDTLDEALQLGLGKPFAELRLTDDEKNRRPPWPIDSLRKLATEPDLLKGLNEEARAIILVMVETGMRPIEICGLEKSDIWLDGEIPYVSINAKPNRALKTSYSARLIPLVGVSLETLKAFPEGFPRYRDKSSSLSAAVNSYLDENELLPSDAHSLYSIRHTFQDRLTAADMPDRLQADLMGHKFDRPVYGDGPTLSHKLEWLQRLAIT